MGQVEITASFASAQQAQAAVERLRTRGNGTDIRAIAGGTVQVAVPAATVAETARLLRDSGAMDVVQAEPSPSSGWMSHQNGLVTGTGVEPGAGDAEAGAG